ncbi:hypothetical protein [Micromonospora sp. HUAS LYJ1]|uniref:hypothetical protein n=1 Tax=Micromonospora sp. HUAS LYJ1 TaxID=3061626 RepID=UPI00267300CB|nr:hypothetical protein [Micromonospora sp. HUAS LYJ1]WKU07990.1 hypothetical protein Q2K16_13655 [Micromonospora sp. HUAS LYJ1]
MTTPTDRIPLRTELATAGQLAQALEANRQLHTRLGRAESEARAMVRDRDAALDERNQARRERDTLAARLEHAETARIDVDGDLWRPAPDAQWTLSGDRTVRLDEDVLEHLHGPTRPVLIIDNGPQDDEPAPAPSPGSGPARVQGSPDPRHVARIDRTGRVWFSAENGWWRGAGTCHLSTSAETLERLHGPTVEAVVVPASAPEPLRPADWEQRAIDAVREALEAPWSVLGTGRASEIAVRAIIDAGLAGPGGRCPRCGSTYPRTLPPGEDARCWTCATEDQTGLDEPANTTREG